MLTAIALRNLHPRDKVYKVSDSSGLYLQVQPNGSAYWRLKFRVHGKEKVAALGVFRNPDGVELVGLAEARQLRDKARSELRTGLDPTAEKRKRKLRAAIASRCLLRDVATEWLEEKADKKWRPGHAESAARSLENNVYPSLGDRPIGEIEASDLLAVLQKIEKRGAHELRRKVHQRLSAIFRFGVARQYCKRDPAADLRGAFEAPATKHHPALKPAEMPELVAAIETYDGAAVTRLATKLLLLTALRTGELRGAEWGEIDFDAAVWTVPATRMKVGDVDHLVPLAPQALTLLAELRAITGTGQYLFPNAHNAKKHMSENAILYMLYRCGFHSRMTGHGMRSIFSTWANEAGFSPDAVERQLAHQERNKIRAAYDRGARMPERVTMMRAWADAVDGFAAPQRAQRKVITGKFGAKH